MEPKEKIVELREKTGLTRSQFSKWVGMPLRTLESWERGDREPPKYVLDLLDYKVKHDRPKVNIKDMIAQNQKRVEELKSSNVPTKKAEREL